jgi:hypothetical protein
MSLWDAISCFIVSGEYACCCAEELTQCRCHVEYHESTNTKDSCQVPHCVESIERIYKKATESAFGCCGKLMVDECDAENDEDGFCFEGYHTTDYKLVEFTLKDIVTRGRDNSHVVLCSDHGCDTREVQRQEREVRRLKSGQISDGIGPDFDDLTASQSSGTP